MRERLAAVPGVTAAWSVMLLLIGAGCSSEGTLTLELSLLADKGALTLSNLEAFAVPEAAYRAFRSTDTESLYQQAVAMQEESRAVSARLAEEFRKIESTNGRGAGFGEAVAALEPLRRQGKTNADEYRALKRTFHDGLTKDGLRMSQDGPTTFSVTIPRKQRHVLVVWGTPSVGDPEERSYWVGWVGLYGKRKRTITLDITKASQVFPFREPPMTW